MYLMDCIAQTPRCVEIRDTVSGNHSRLPGAGMYRDDIVTTPVRYVLDDGITALCADTVRNRQDFLADALDIFRMPFPEFWIEWNETIRTRMLAQSPIQEGAPGFGRAGILVKMDGSERAGSLRIFWSTNGQTADINPAQIRFDLDAKPVGNAVWTLTAPNDELQNVFDRVSIELDPDWHAYYRQRAGSPQKFKDLVCKAVGPAALDFPFMLAFVFLLMAQVHDTGPSDLSALNRRRVQSGKPALLEHRMVTQMMFGEQIKSASGTSVFDRTTPRLHLVRGHLVRRGDKVFWRASHFRGRGCGLPLQKTIRLVLSNAA